MSIHSTTTQYFRATPDKAAMAGAELCEAVTRSFAASVLHRIADAIERRRQRQIDRDAFRTMLALDDAILADIGVTRDDIRWAASLPLSVNASCALAKAKRGK